MSAQPHQPARDPVSPPTSDARTGEDVIARVVPESRSNSARDIAEQQIELTRKAQALESEAARLKTREAELDSREAELTEATETLAAREADLATREIVSQTTAEELEELRASLEKQRDTLDAERKKVRDKAEAQQREQRRLEEQKSFLADREQDLEARSTAQLEAQRENAKLAQQAEQAKRDADTRIKKAEAEKETLVEVIAELEKQNKLLAQECQDIREKIFRSAPRRPGVNDSAPDAPVAAEPAPTVIPAVPMTAADYKQRPIRVMLMAAVLGLVGFSIGVGVLSDPALAAWMLGAAFSLSLLGSPFANRAKPSAAVMMVGVVAAGFGLWILPLISALETMAASWNIPIHVLPANVQPNLPIAGAIAISGFCAAIAVLIAFPKPVAGGAVFAATTLAAAAALAPAPHAITLPLAAALWHFITLTGLLQGSERGP